MVTVKFRTGNSSFWFGEDRQQFHMGEVARTLREVADKIEAGYEDGKVFDRNGNNVGTFEVEF